MGDLFSLSSIKTFSPRDFFSFLNRNIIQSCITRKAHEARASSLKFLRLPIFQQLKKQKKKHEEKINLYILHQN